MRLLPALTLLAALAAPAGAARAEEIVLSNGDWLPYMSESLPGHGIISRLVSDAFASQGIKVRYVFRPWPRALAEARQMRVDGSIVWSPGKPDSERIHDFHYSDVVFFGRSVFFHLKTVPFAWNDWPDLARWRIGGSAGYEYRFEQTPNVRIDRGPTDELCLRKLLARRIDACAMVEDVGKYVMRVRMTAAEAAQLAISNKPYGSTPYHLILPREGKNSERLRAAFNRGLQKLKDDGSYQRYMRDLDLGNY
jgi:polar amino acid transport system substrate-binding protein